MAYSNKTGVRKSTKTTPKKPSGVTKSEQPPKRRMTARTAELLKSRKQAIENPKSTIMKAPRFIPKRKPSTKK